MILCYLNFNRCSLDGGWGTPTTTIIIAGSASATAIATATATTTTTTTEPSPHRHISSYLAREPRRISGRIFRSHCGSSLAERATWVWRQPPLTLLEPSFEDSAPRHIFRNWRRGALSWSTGVFSAATVPCSWSGSLISHALAIHQTSFTRKTTTSGGRKRCACKRRTSMPRLILGGLVDGKFDMKLQPRNHALRSEDDSLADSDR